MKFLIKISILTSLATRAFFANGQWVELLTGNGTTAPQVTALTKTVSGEILVGTSRGIFASSNNGSSWYPANSGLSTGPVNAFLINGNSVFVAMNSGDRILRSTDDGATWTKVNNGLPTAAATKLTTVSGRIFAQINNGDLYFSENDGAEWSKVINGPSVTSSITSSGTTLFRGSSSGVYRSVDSGASWSLSNTGLTNLNIISLDATESAIIAWTFGGTFLSTNNGSSWYSTLLFGNYPKIVQLGSTILAFDVLSPIKRSTNNGASWATILNTPNAGAIISVGNSFIAGTINGIYISQNDGISWSSSNIGLMETHPTFSVDGANIIATDGTSIKISTDWGNSWTTTNVGNTPHVSTLVKGNTFYVSNRNGNYSSTNKGSTWSSIVSLGTSEKFLAKGESILYASDSYSLYRSLDGTLWTEVSNRLNWISSITANSSRVFSGSSFGGSPYTGVFTSQNDGVSWNQVNNTLPQINSIAFNGDLLLCATSSGIYKSSDKGITWSLSGFEGHNINSIIFNNGSILAAHKEIEVSTDNSLSWHTITNEIAASLGEHGGVTTLSRSGTRILAGTSTGAVWISACVAPPTPSISGIWSHHPTTVSSSSASNNQWFLNETKIESAVNQTYQVMQSGSYSVQVEVDGCLSEMSTPYIITDCIIPPTPTISEATAEPNPTLESSAIDGNQWFLDDTLIQNAHEQIYIPEESGNYTVMVTIDGCESNMSDPYPVIYTGDISQFEMAITVYPNPVKDELIISFENLYGQYSQIQVSVMDFFGKKVLEKTINSDVQSVINVAFLNPCVYLIELKDSGKIIRKKFIKL